MAYERGKEGDAVGNVTCHMGWRQTNDSRPHIAIMNKRIRNLKAIIIDLLEKDALGCGAAASLGGKLCFTLTAAFGKFGRCRFRQVMAPAYSLHVRLGVGLRRYLKWWLRFLEHYHPRQVPSAIHSLPLVISYSDGEGGLAGIGAAVWSSCLARSLAVYTEVPVELRRYFG